MSSLVAYYIISALTVASPGSAVVFTVTNMLTKGPGAAVRGYLGVAIGIMAVGYISHEILIQVGNHIPSGFGWGTLFGACYFLWLAIANFRTGRAAQCDKNTGNRELLSGVMISLTNPKALLFFTSVFPLYLNEDVHYSLLIIIFSVNVILIHSVYTYCASKYKQRLSLNDKVWRNVTICLYLFLSLSCFMYAFEQI